MKKTLLMALGLCYLAAGCANTETPSNPPTTPAPATPVATATAADEMTKAQAEGQFTACKSNIKNIGTALEMYATDYSGKYPPAEPGLDLLAPNYLRAIPSCPAAGEVTYSYAEGPDAELNGSGYQDYYEVRCVGSNHTMAGAEGDLPVYTGLVGIITGDEELEKYTAEMKAAREKKEKEQE